MTEVPWLPSPPHVGPISGPGLLVSLGLAAHYCELSLLSGLRCRVYVVINQLILSPGTRVSGRCEWLRGRHIWCLVTPGVTTCAALTRGRGPAQARPEQELWASVETGLSHREELTLDTQIRDTETGRDREWWDSARCRHWSDMSRRKQGIVPKKSDQEDQEPELRNGDSADKSEQGEKRARSYCYSFNCHRFSTFSNRCKNLC